MRVRRLGRIRVGGRPLQRAGRAFDLFPFEFEQVLKVSVVPLRRVWRPTALNAVGHRVLCETRALGIVPAETHGLHRRNFGWWADFLRGHHAMALTKRVAARDQGDGFFVIHRHAGEGHPDITCRPHRITVRIGAFRINVDVEAADILRVPDFRAPVRGIVRLPRVEPSAAEAVGRESHDLEGTVACQNHKIAPGKPVTVFVLDGLQETPRLVGIAVVPPATDRSKTLHRRTGTASPVRDPIGTRCVPRHTDHLRTVIIVVWRPPGDRCRQKLLDVPLEGFKIELRELRGVVKIRTKRVSRQTVLV